MCPPVELSRLSTIVAIPVKIEIKHFIVLVNNRSFYGIMSVAQMNSKLEDLRTHDLEKAAAIQQNMLKKNSNTKGFPFSVCIWNRMANAVGGDYYIAKELVFFSVRFHHAW